MAKGKRYPILKALEDEFNMVVNNKQFDEIISRHIRQTYTPRKIYNLIKIHGIYKQKLDG